MNRLILIVCCSVSMLTQAQVIIPNATQQPAWAFGIYFLNGDGQKDSVFIGYDPGAHRYNFEAGAYADAIFGECLTATDSLFGVSFETYVDSADSMIQVIVLPDFSLGGEKFWLYFTNGVWPVTMTFDHLKLYDPIIPFPDNLGPKAFIELWCYDQPPYLGNCAFAGFPSYFISDDPNNYLPSHIPPAPPLPNNASRLVSDTIVWVGDASYPIDEMLMVFTIEPYLPWLTYAERSLAIFPNPSSGEFRVRGAGMIEVYDVMHNLLFTQQDRLHVDMSDYPEGIYFISNGYGEVQKLILVK